MAIVRALGHILRAIHILLAAATVGVALSTRYSPEEIGIFCMGWFGFPYLWLALCAATLASLAGRQKVTTLVGVCALALTFGEAKRVIDFPTPSGKEAPEGKKGVKLLSYNVLNLVGTGLEAWPEHRADSIAANVSASGADIVCFQESSPVEVVNSRQELRDIKKMWDSYSHHLSHGVNGDLTILTNLPIRKITAPRELGLTGQPPLAFMAADIALGDGDTVRIFNCHLASYMLSGKDIDAVTGLDMGKERVGKLRQIYCRMRNPLCQRAAQTRLLAQAVACSPHPVVICGDFNDTPISYTFAHLMEARPDGDATSGLSEARQTGSLRMARTYRGNLPPLRIDYVIKSGQIETWGYEEHDWAWSDHKAVSVYFCHK